MISIISLQMFGGYGYMEQLSDRPHVPRQPRAAKI